MGGNAGIVESIGGSDVSMAGRDASLVGRVLSIGGSETSKPAFDCSFVCVWDDSAAVLSRGSTAAGGCGCSPEG